MKLSLKSNLRLGLGLSLVILILSSLASYVSIRNLIKSSDLVEHSNTIINGLDNTISTLKDAETGQRGYLLTGNKVFLEPYIGAQEKVSVLYNMLKDNTIDNAYQQRKLDELKNILDLRLNIIEKTINIKSNGGTVPVLSLLEGKSYMDNVRQIIKDMQSEEKRLLAIRTSELNNFSGYTPMLIILAAVLSFLITIFFYRKVSSDYNERVKLQEKLQLINEETANRIQVIQGIAREISSGNYRIRLDDVAKDGLGNLAGSLNAMAESLEYSFGLLEDKEWLQSGIAKLNDQMVGEKDIKTLANDMLIHIVEHTKSHVAALYILGEDKNLYLTGSYALTANEKNHKISNGEGLIGQCLQSNKLMLLDQIDGEITISYATGQTKPKNVVAFPLHRDGIMVGVIELASLNAYTPRKLDFLNNISGNIGLAIHASQNRKKIQEFLEETQAQAEELQAQHSELEALNAELEAQTQKIQASEEELRVQQEELLQSNQELEERTSLLEEKNQLIQERNIDIQQKAEQLEQSTKYKSEFLANMSHELRTPLNSILLLSRLMADNEELDAEYTEYASVIQSSGQGLLSLIDEILDLSKIEAGKMDLEIHNVTVDEVLTDMQSLFNPIAKDKQLEMEVLVDEDLPTMISTDKMRLEQILKNLLSNAFKFTTEGKVSLVLSSNKKNKTITFNVKDTGIGIAKSKLNMVFEAFQQADGSTRRKFGGTGLGLSISRELARLLGGDIELKSQENVGSEFILTIPLNFADKESFLEEQQIKKQTEENHPYEEFIPTYVERYTVDRIPGEVEDDRASITENDKVILIIEDDTAFAKMLLDFTRKRNYKGLVAVRGDVGIEMANQYNPIAILLDIQLPVKDGWQVMEELKNNAATRPIPVHIMSSLSVKRESLLKGAVDFIDKPVALEHMKQIFEKLEDALSRSPKKVLIVEENEQHAKALSYFLASANIQTLVVSNVSESIEALNKKEVDCVILDMGVPDKNAYETLETIKKNDGLENLPIIIFTGKSLSKGEESRIKQYADSIVLKTAHSYQRILDEAGLFLHLVEEKDKSEKVAVRNNLGGLNDVLKDKVVIIADDDVRNIFSLTKALEQHQMKVLAAVDGKDALKVLAENPKVDVVLMDMMMPELDGYEATKEIRKIPAYKQLPILAVTAKAMMGDREKCIAAGASDYISKPVDVDQLVSLLRVWLYDKV
ncbi:response regulator [Pedobacter polaris]|uniref:histidine kinase n=1 Tax=Pedobacter polaris TaxID=2571273 RepID=A0A4U1CUJ3_9SPHI|nr:response regulator [Pedobacter polaris]TKC12524.1 response regulator [Pedobacter polaris]